MRGTVSRLLLFGALTAAPFLYGLAPGPARADDWQVTRSEFDPRLLGPLKEQVRQRPDDAAGLRRLVGLYKRHSSLEKLAQELAAQAEKSGAATDYYLCAQVARERGQLDEALRYLAAVETAPKKTAGGARELDRVKVALWRAELQLKRSPPDGQAARATVEQTLAALDAKDPRRRTVVRKLADLSLAAGDHEGAVRSLEDLLKSAPAGSPEAWSLRREIAEAQAHGGKTRDALATWQAIEASPQLRGDPEKRAQAGLRVGELAEAANDDLGAIAAYRKALALLPQQHYLRRDLYEHLIALHRKRDDLPALLAQLEKDWPEARRSFSDWELLGRLHDERGSMERAIAAYRSALRKDPSSIEARRRLIALLERSGAQTEVLREYEQILRYAPGDSRAYLELAERQFREGKKPLALETLRRAAVRFAADPSLHSALADLYQRWGEAELALREAETLVRLDPRDESNLISLGELYWARGKKERADEVWKRLLTLFPNRAVGQARLADVYAEHGLMPQALELYQKAVRAEPNNLQIRRGLAQATERLGRQREAATLWEQLYFAAKGPTNRALRLEARQRLATLVAKESRLQSVYYSLQRRFMAQATGLDAAKGPPSEELLALGLLDADMSLLLGRTGEAEATLMVLKQRFPDGPARAEVLLSLVAVYRQQRKLDEAIAVLKEAAALLPDRRRELYAQIAELSMQTYRDDEAIQYAQQAGTDAQGELRLGELLERKDDVPRAMAAYKHAIELDGRLFRAHMALARLHLQRGELREAAALYRDVVRRTPQEELVLEAGRKAIDLHEHMGTLPELLRELTPLSYTSLPKPVYRRLLLTIYERYAGPLVTLARSGDADAEKELRRLGEGGLRPLSETLVDGETAEQRVAVALLGEMGNPSAAQALLSLASAAQAQEHRESESRKSEELHTGRTVEIDLVVDSILAAARLGDPHSGRVFAQLAQGREKEVRIAALYGLAQLGSRLEKNEAAVVEQLAAEPGSGVLISPAVRAMAILGAGELYAERGLPPRLRTQLVAALERRRRQPEEIDDQLAQAAAHALGRTRERTALPVLLQTLRDGDEGVQKQAAWALGRLGDAQAVAPLLRVVFLARDPARLAAVTALSELGPGESDKKAAAGSMVAGPRLPRAHRGSAGIQVTRLLADAATVTPRGDASLLLRQPAAVTAAILEALGENRDLALRTLADLEAPRVDGGAHSRGLSLGPLEPLLLKTPEAGQLRKAVAEGLSTSLRRLVQRERLQPGTESDPTPAPGRAPDIALEVESLQVLARLCELETLRDGSLRTLASVARTESRPEVATVAATLIGATATDKEVEQLGPVLDALLGRAERFARLLALQAAAQPGGRRLLSKDALSRAERDPDGYVREAATRLRRSK